MNKSLSSIALAIFSVIANDAAHGMEIKLYPTGPAEDSAFVRFVDGDGGGLRITASGSQSQIDLDSNVRSTDYMMVAGNTTIQGELSQGDKKKTVEISTKPSEFITVLGWSSEQGLQTSVVREVADEFTSIRASIAFYDLNESCDAAAVQVMGRSVFLFENVEAGKWVRRQINPVPLSVRLVCSGLPVGQSLDLGALQAGERYSLFLLPGDPAESFFHVKDTLAY